MTKKNNCYYCREESRKGRNQRRSNKIRIMKLNHISLVGLHFFFIKSAKRNLHQFKQSSINSHNMINFHIWYSTLDDHKNIDSLKSYSKINGKNLSKVKRVQYCSNNLTIMIVSLKALLVKPYGTNFGQRKKECNISVSVFSHSYRYGYVFFNTLTSRFLNLYIPYCILIFLM